MLLWLEARAPEVQTVSLMVVQAQLDGTEAWARTSVRVFSCCEKGSQRLLLQKWKCQDHFAWPLHLPVCWGRQSWKSWVNRPCPQATAHVFVQLHARYVQGIHKTHLLSKQGGKKSRTDRKEGFSAALLWNPLGAPTGVSHLTYRPHKFSLRLCFRLQEAAGSRNPACSYSEGYGGLCHIIMFINPSSFILKLARAQFLLFL